MIAQRQSGVVGVVCALVLAWAALAACGDEERCALIEVDVGRYQVPVEIDRLHFETRDADGLFVERSYPLTAGTEIPSLALCQGGRTPAALTLIVYGFRDVTEITRTPAIEIAFDTDEPHYRVTLP